MAIYSEKNKLLFGAVQSVIGTPVACAGTDVFAATELTYSDELTTEESVYVGNELERDTHTSITDSYCQISLTTMLPVVGPVGSGQAATLDNFPMTRFLEACGGKGAALVGIDEEAGLHFTNSEISNSYLSLEFRRGSPDDPGQQNLYGAFDMRGTVDLELEIGKRPLLKFNYMGNCNLPERETELTPDYSNQKTLVSPVPRMGNIIHAELVADGGSFSGTPVKNFCFSKILASNLFGFDYTRRLLSCNEGFSKTAVTTDLTITVAENRADDAFNPEHIRGQYFKLKVSFGLAGGYVSTFEWSRIQLIGHPATEIGNDAAKDLAFKNVGNIDWYLTVGEAQAGGGTLSTKPKMGTGGAVLQSDSAGVTALFAAMTEVSTATAGSRVAGNSGSALSLTPGTGDYGWFWCLGSAAPSGVTFNTTLGAEGWNGAGLAGQNGGASPIPSTVHITHTDADNNVWHGFRQDLSEVAVSFWTT
jgi:hypothetical protein